MNKQEIANHVISFLAKQGCQSGNSESCYYRMLIDNKTFACAAGCLFPNSAYDTAMEHLNISDVLELIQTKVPTSNGYGVPVNFEDFVNFPKWLAENPWFTKEEPFIRKLQLIHDNDRIWKGFDVFKREFSDMLLAHGLSTDIFNTVTKFGE